MPGSVDAIARLRADGVRLIFMTNDPRGARSDYAERLSGLGIPAEEGEVITAASTLAAVLGERERTGATAFVIGSPSLEDEIAAAGLEVLAGEAGRDAEIVAVGGHDDFGYRELRIAIQAVRRGAHLYAAGRDATFPMPDGPWPGTGSIVAAVEVGGGATAIAVGKPEPEIFEVARSVLAGCDRIAIVGDNLDADIAGARGVGARSVWVKRDYDWLTYESGTEPDLVAASFPEAVRLLLDDVAE